MGVVLEAHDEELRRRVAVKVMAAHLLKRPDAKARFLREARAAAAIDHENVVPIYHVGEDGGVPYIVMPLLLGVSLESRLSCEGRLPPSEVIQLGMEVAAGLAAAHARDLVHRDIKPANIWLAGGSGSAKILDFGLARAADGTDGLTDPAATPGTPAYLAPEQVDGKPADARSDLFSLGATLYRAATGRVAFSGPTVSAVLRAVTAHDPPPPHQIIPTVPVPLSDLILRLLAKEPSARPQSAREVVNALASLGDGAAGDHATTDEPSSSAPTVEETCAGGTGHSQEAVSQHGQRRRVRWIAAAAVAAALLAAIGGWLVARPPWHNTVSGPAADGNPAPAPVRYRGQVDVLVEREDQNGKVRLLRLNEPGALPLRKMDKFRVEGRVDPPAYLYVVGVDPGHDITPVYPWDPTIEDEAKMWKSRPAREEKVGRVSLPRNVGKCWTVKNPKEGVATMVLFARPTPLDVPDEEVRKWFESLPDLPLPPGGDQATVWFDNYAEVRDPDRPRTFGEVGSDDAFARWQGLLQKALGDKAAFQTAVSFARRGGK
jgi:hypothetical protein